MKLKTVGARCIMGGTREVPGPTDLVPSGTGKIQPQRQSGCGWNSTAFCWALGPGSTVQTDLQDSELKYFCLHEDLSGDLEPEEGHWVVQHSWLGCK